MALSAEDLQKLSEYFETDKFDTFDDAKSYFDDTFARKENYKKELFKDPDFIAQVTGRRIGIIETKSKQFAKEFGIDLEADEFKDKKAAEDILDYVLTKAKTKHKEELDNIQKSIGDPGEAVKELENKYNAEKRLKEKYKKDFEEVGASFENYKVEQATQSRQKKLKDSIEGVFSGIPYADEALKDELKIAGFKTKILSDVNFDLDEQENFVLLGKDKLPINNPTKAGAVYTPEDYIKEQAIKFGIFKLNENGGQKTQQTFQQKQRISDLPPEQPIRKIHPAAARQVQ